MTRHLTVKSACRYALLLVAATLSVCGCSMQMAKSERPDWSLNGPKVVAVPQKKYGDWNGPDAPKPQTFENGTYEPGR